MFTRTLIITTLSILSISGKNLPEIFQRKIKSENIKKSEIWKRVVTSDPNKLWEDAVIPYEISTGFSDNYKEMILLAMDIWESNTCIKFVPAEPIHKFRIVIKNVGSCSCCSLVGKVQERQQVVFNENYCVYVVAILHELAHTMGFYHEQSRPDRDDFIKVLYDNINKNNEGDYAKLSKDEADTLGFSYDFDSIMHYSSYSGSIGGKETMQALNKSVSLKEMRTALSETDIAAANKLYKCPDCYFKLKDKTNLIAISPNSQISRKGSCQWFIERGPGEFIEFYVQNVHIPESSECSSDYLQFQDGYRPESPIIDRVCGKRNTKAFYKTGTNNLLITYKSSRNSGKDEFFVEYRVICNGTIKGDYGMLQNPKYDEPNSYDSVCQWVLMVPMGYRVALTFDTFDINEEENCLSDYIEVIDGEVDSGNVILNKVCGKKLPELILSTNNILTVTYVSERRNANNKFSANFVKEINECELPGRGGCTDICINTIGSYRCECFEGRTWVDNTNSCEKIINSCGGTIPANERMVIASPSYPNPYPNNTDCTWNILENNLRLTFFYLDINGSQLDCSDQIIVKSPLQNNVICGMQQGVAAEFRYVFGLQIQFVSKQNINRSGFKILVEPI